MAEGQKKESESGVLGRLAGRGEDALTRFMDELGRNPRVTDALGRAMSAKGRVDDTTRKTLAQVGLAAADEVRDLRGQLERLEERLSRLERGSEGGSGGGASAGPAGRTGRRSTTSTKSSGGTAPKRSSAGRARSDSSSRPSKDGGGASGSDSG